MSFADLGQAPARERNWAQKLPLEFEADFYRSRYEDLAAMTAEEAERHFEMFGRQEGRLASPAALRTHLIGLLPQDVLSLEIGPGANPVLAGELVSYFDVLPPEATREWARIVGKDPAGVPDVTHNSPQGDLSVIPGTFDLVLSSHCVEHQPDLLGHLNSVSERLRSGGHYVFLVPDYRFCFDALRPVSSLGEVIEAHLQGRKFHSLAHRIDFTLMITHNDAGRHWNGDHGAPLGRLEAIRHEIDVWKRKEDHYVDTHAWTLTPNVMRQILTFSRQLGLLDLKLLRVYDTPRNVQEFAVVLEK